MRLKTLIVVCYGCGLRIGELLRIKVQDIDGQRNVQLEWLSSLAEKYAMFIHVSLCCLVN
ncbi:hypothetical protein [Pseudoalteromonas distincta]|uniref:hypothetical protein n=1 Tax=Pseudoalteromonas distincta TaxID=77608 RepID=UPI0021D4D000|nr:hypothetical protein [Pseudoalteromonas distincta]